MSRARLIGLEMDAVLAVGCEGTENDGGDGPGRNDAEKGDAERARDEGEAVIVVAGHG